MKVSRSSLHEWLPCEEVDSSTIADKLTRAGLEVDHIETIENDDVIDIDLTPNRGDCFSVRGIARELSALLERPMRDVPKQKIKPSLKQIYKINVIAKPLCPRYLACVLTVDNAKPTPDWLKQKLMQHGLNSVNCVVDCLNWIMWNLGQPLHAFDLDKIQGAIAVRKAKPGEKLTLLDESEISLSEADLVIADDKSTLALAGVMGSLDSGVTENTTHILIESAYFDAASIAKTALRHKKQSDAAQRFSRGVDFNLPEEALVAACALLEKECQAQCGEIVRVEAAAFLPELPVIEFDIEKASRLSGMPLLAQEVKNIFDALHFQCKESQGLFQVTPPSYRYDIRIPEDLLEEVLRLKSYDAIPEIPLTLVANVPSQSFDEYALKQCLASHGYHEAITYSFVPASQNQYFGKAETCIDLLNPISQEMAVMRHSLWPSLLLTAQHNVNRQQTRVRLFELGKYYARQNETTIDETPVFAGLALGAAELENWANDRRELDFFDIKGELENVFAQFNVAGIHFERDKHAALHEGQTAAIHQHGERVGYMGLIAPSLQSALGFKQKVFLFEVALSVFDHKKSINYHAISKFPSVRRDFAIVVDQKVSAKQLLQCIQTHAGDSLLDTFVFDVYTGNSVGEERKSVAIALLLQHPERTLTDEEVNTVTEQVTKALASTFSATLRD